MILSSGNFIDGQWQAASGEIFFAINPCCSEPIWQGQLSTEQEAKLAYHSAKNASVPWQKQGLQARYQHVKVFLEKLLHIKSELISALSLETGKPLWESELEINAVCEKVNHAYHAYIERTPPTPAIHSDERHLQFKALGVVVVLGAFNFPLHLSHGHMIPALLAGNTVIYKPSELTPAINERIMHCWSHLPKGVINLVQGDKHTAKYLIQQPIQAVYFTGSYATGVALHHTLAGRPEVLLALEMGGNNPLIIDTIQNLNAGIYHTIISAYISAGQRCSCARRLLLPNNAFGDIFLTSLIKKIPLLKIGEPTAAPPPFMGPLIRPSHAEKALAQQAQCLKQGATPLLTMTALFENSGFLSPGLIDMSRIPSDTPYFDEEIFAPLLQIDRYDSFEEALHLANRTQYGLCAGLLSDHPEHYQYFSEHINAGVLSWNRPTTGASSQLPFGGIGKSGNYRPSGYFAADYCAYPVASQTLSTLSLPSKLLPGIAHD